MKTTSVATLIPPAPAVENKTADSLLALHRCPAPIQGLDSFCYLSAPTDQPIQSRQTVQITQKHCDNAIPVVQCSEAAVGSLKNKKIDKEVRFSSVTLSSYFDTRKEAFHKAITEYDHKSAEDRSRFISDKVSVSKNDGADFLMLDGEDQLVARQSLKKGELIAHFGGVLLTNEELERSSIPERVLFQIDDYSIQIPKTKLTLTGLSSNMMHCINDGTIEDNNGKRVRERENVELVVVYRPRNIENTVVHLPSVYVFASKNIDQGDILWLSYGKSYWENKAKSFLRGSFPLPDQKIVITRNPKILEYVGYLFEAHLVGGKTFAQCFRERPCPYADTYVRGIFNSALMLLRNTLCEESDSQPSTSKSTTTYPTTPLTTHQTGNALLSDFARQLGIKNISRLHHYVRKHEESSRQFCTIKDVMATAIEHPEYTAKQIADNVNKKIFIVQQALERVDACSSTMNAENFAQHYLISNTRARLWLQSIDNIRKIVKRSKLSFLELLPETEKTEFRKLFEEFHSRPYHKLLKERLNQTHQHLPFTENSIISQIKKTKTLVISDDKQSREVLLNLGFTENDLKRLRVSIKQEHNKKTPQVRAVSEWLNQKNDNETLDLNQLRHDVLKAHPDIFSEQIYHVLLHARRQLKKDESGQKVAAYLKLSEKKTMQFIRLLNKLSKKTALTNTSKSNSNTIIKRKAEQEQPVETAKKVKLEPSVVTPAHDILRRLYIQGNTRKHLIKERDVFTKDGNKLTAESIKDIIKEWDSLAVNQDETLITEHYGITLAEARQWLNAYYKTQILYPVPEPVEEKNKQAFFASFFDSQNTTQSVAYAKRKILDQTVSGERKVSRWLKAWKESPATKHKDARKLSEQLNISEDLSKKLIDYYHTTPNQRSHFQASNLKSAHIMEFFSLYYLVSPEKRKTKTELIGQLSKKHQISSKTLRNKSIQLESMVANKLSKPFIATKLGLPTKFTDECIDVIIQEQQEQYVYRQQQAAVFRVLWKSGERPISIADAAQSVGANVTKVKKWVEKFKERIERTAFSVQATAKVFHCDPHEIEAWVACIRQSDNEEVHNNKLMS